MPIRRLLLALCCLLWAYWCRRGWEGIAHIESQHVPGYPAIEQYVLYLVVPVGLCLIGLTALVLRWRSTASLMDAVTISGLLFLLLPYAAYARGGI